MSTNSTTAAADVETIAKRKKNVNRAAIFWGSLFLNCLEGNTLHKDGILAENGITMKASYTLSLPNRLYSPLLATILLLSSCLSLGQQKQEEEPTFWSLLDAGDTEGARQLFMGRENIDTTDSEGRTPLHAAIELDNEALAQFLISMGAPLSTLDSNKRSPLDIACMRGNINTMRLLAEAGADILLEGALSMTPFDYALEGLATEGRLSTLEALITPENINTRDEGGRNLLQRAVLKGKKTAVELLLEKGADPALVDKAGKTALDSAWLRTDSEIHAEIAELLIQKGARSDKPGFAWFLPAVRSANYNVRLEDGLTPLHFAAKNGYDGYISFLISRGADIKVKNSAGSTPLHEAIRAGHLGAARLLINAGSDVNTRDAKGNTSMHLIMPLQTREEGMRLLLEKGANPNTKDNFGDAPIHIALRLNMSTEILTLLLSHGADINLRNSSGQSPLHTAIELARKKHIPTLLEQGADIFATDIKGITPFDLAIGMGRELTKTLLTEKNITSSDNRGNTILHIALEAKAPGEIIRLLLEEGVPISSRNKQGETALHIAVRDNHKEAGELLILNGGDLFATDANGINPINIAAFSKTGFPDWILNSVSMESRDGQGNSILHYMANWRRDELIPVLIARGMSADMRNATGETALFAAVKGDSPSTVEVLLDAGANPLARDSLGNSALHAAVRWNAREAAITLMDKGIDINARNMSGKTALHEAIRLGMSDLEMILVNAGADFEARDSLGNTPLFEAVNAGLAAPVERLLEVGANPSSRNTAGDTPLHQAVALGRSDIITLLLARGASIHSKNATGVTPFTLSLMANQALSTVLLTKDRLMQTDDEGNSPLHLAIKEGASVELVKELIKMGARVWDPDARGKTAIRIAVEKDMRDQVQALSAAGANIFTSAEDGESALSLVLKKDLSWLKALFLEGDIKSRDELGNTALHYAAYKGSPEQILYLLEAGADTNTRNVAGETPADLARRWKKGDNETLLLKK